jgi:F0F1-type ATP synthase epsilon subunit
VTPGEDETRVDVLAEHAVLPSEVDVAAARTRAQELQDREDTEAELARALTRAEHGTG